MGSDLAALEQQLLASLSKDQLPLHIVATKAGQPIGTAALKLQELAELFPDKQFWLGSVFVEESHRGSKVASDMTMKTVELAQARELPHLHLQTLDLSGGLYAKLGWEPIEQFTFRGAPTLLMCKIL